jgi:arsenate reductase (thioredoxin)
MRQDRPVVLFLCVHNAGRSQMAAALLARQARDKVVIFSAGSDPGEKMNPAVVVAMAEFGIDISGERPKKLTDDMADEADVIVTMGCGDACPVYPGKQYVDWELPDPAGKSLEEVRLIRDDLDTRVRALVAELVPDPSGGGESLDEGRARPRPRPL